MRHVLFIGMALITGCLAADDGASTDSTDSTDGSDTADVSTTDSEISSAPGPYFATSMFWNRDISTATKSSTSDTIINSLKNAGGWGNGNVVQIDFALDVLKTTSTTPKKTWTTTGDWYNPDCDHVAMPVPTGGAIEDETGYACTGDGDCHMLVWDATGQKLYEMFRANMSGSTLYGGCQAVWDATKTWTSSLRGEQCTSAEAGGMPIAPLLFNADEVAAGHIDHAIRFILPNSRIRRGGYVHPATHATATSGGSGLPPYGVNFRLRADYPVNSLPTPGARVVARAMQKYGMYLADGGNIALTAQSDKHTTHKWAGLLGAHDLAALKVTDFEVISHGAMIPWTDDCIRKY
jgi:serine/threonine-protein kinase